MLLHRQVENGLYPIGGSKSLQNKLLCLMATIGITTSMDHWHSRLGDSSKFVLESLSRIKSFSLSNSVNKLGFCSSCQLGKAKQLPFHELTRQSAVPLSLVHSDVWASPLMSVCGCRYYVLFVDDFSRFSWMYSLYHKSDVFATFMKFKSLAENYFSCSIKQLQTENYGEFLSNQFKEFLSKHGIFHRLTCPNTSQQNGIAEWKHCHI